MSPGSAPLRPNSILTSGSAPRQVPELDGDPRLGHPSAGRSPSLLHGGLQLGGPLPRLGLPPGQYPGDCRRVSPPYPDRCVMINDVFTVLRLRVGPGNVAGVHKCVGVSFIMFMKLGLFSLTPKAVTESKAECLRLWPSLWVEHAMECVCFGEDMSCL